MIDPPNSNFAETFHRRQLNKIAVRDLYNGKGSRTSFSNFLFLLRYE